MAVLTSVCGCSLVLDLDERPLLSLSSGGVTLTRVLEQDAATGIEEVAAYLNSCVIAAEDDLEHGYHYDSLCDLSYLEPTLGLQTDVEDLGDGVLRLRFALIVPDEVSLDLCHATVTLDVSLAQVADFVANLVTSLDSSPIWWVA